MNKRERQAMIRRLIEDNSVGTQEDMVRLLEENGMKVTQATVSRDIREMRLSKLMDENGNVTYTVSSASMNDNVEKFSRVLREAFVSAEPAGSILVIKTITGMAMAVAASLDKLALNEIIGTIAGDDTIFLATASGSVCAALRDKIYGLIR